MIDACTALASLVGEQDCPWIVSPAGFDWLRTAAGAYGVSPIQCPLCTPTVRHDVSRSMRYLEPWRQRATLMMAYCLMGWDDVPAHQKLISWATGFDHVFPNERYRSIVHGCLQAAAALDKESDKI